MAVRLRDVLSVLIALRVEEQEEIVTTLEGFLRGTGGAGKEQPGGGQQGRGRAQASLRQRGQDQNKRYEVRTETL